MIGTNCNPDAALWRRPLCARSRRPEPVLGAVVEKVGKLRLGRNASGVPPRNHGAAHERVNRGLRPRDCATSVAENPRIALHGPASIPFHPIGSGGTRTGRAECGVQSASEFVGDLYREQAGLLAAKATLDKDEFYDLFAHGLRKRMQAPRRSQNNRPIGPLPNTFFGWSVLPGTEVTIEKIALVSGNRQEPRQSLSRNRARRPPQAGEEASDRADRHHEFINHQPRSALVYQPH
jgi:hypothetical protein